MTVEEAGILEYPCRPTRLETLVGCGASYVCLGQTAPTLSGGEAQRVKLASELSHVLQVRLCI